MPQPLAHAPRPAAVMRPHLMSVQVTASQRHIVYDALERARGTALFHLDAKPVYRLAHIQHFHSFL